MNDPKQAVATTPKRESALVEYVPFGAQDKIKLSIAIVQNLIAVPTKSGKTCSERDALKFMAMCQAKRLNPFEGDAYLIGYDGRDGATFSLITAHQTYLKRAEVNPEYDGLESGVLVRDENHELKELEGDFVDDGLTLVGGWARVHFKNRKHPMYKRLKLSRFQKSFGVWADDSPGMIVKCAEADALRSSFPTMLGGLYMREEVEIVPTKMARPDFSTPAAAPQLFNAAPPAENGKSPEPAPEPPPTSASDPPETPTTSEKAGGFNPLKAVRNLAKMASVTESEVLEFCQSHGMTDGSQGELGEVPKNILQALADKWPDVAQEIKAARAGGESKGGLL
jgi:phage recombination protein Bet